MLSGWLELPSEEDGAFWAVNLMKYRPLAEYADGRETTLTGREADDLYAPYGPIEAVGGMVAFGADVSNQLSGSPEYDRVAIVRYPSRAAFFEMQRRDDFQELHVHKDAGMEFTTVIACLPRATVATSSPDDESLVLRVRRLTPDSTPAADPEGVSPVTHLEAEGVIIGDGRSWDEVLFDRMPATGVERLATSGGVEDEVTMILDRPVIDELAGSIESAPS